MSTGPRVQWFIGTMTTELLPRLKDAEACWSYWPEAAHLRLIQKQPDGNSYKSINALYTFVQMNLMVAPERFIEREVERLVRAIKD